MKCTGFTGVILCTSDRVRRVEGTYYLHPQGVNDVQKRAIRAIPNYMVLQLRRTIILNATAVRTSKAAGNGWIWDVSHGVRCLQADEASREAGADVTQSRTCIINVFTRSWQDCNITRKTKPSLGNIRHESPCSRWPSLHILRHWAVSTLLYFTVDKSLTLLSAESAITRTRSLYVHVCKRANCGSQFAKSSPRFVLCLALLKNTYAHYKRSYVTMRMGYF
jgi:hypothetical protein